VNHLTSIPSLISAARSKVKPIETIVKLRRASRLLIIVLAVFPTFGLAAAMELTRKQAEELVLNIPDAVVSKACGGCPKASLLWVNDKQSTIFFAIHNLCDKSGAPSDKIGNFTVDLKNGEV
jgi:hypothetical protein